MSVLPQFLLQVPSNAQRLRDIKPPLDVPQNIFPYILLGGLILAVIIGTVWVFLRQRRKTQPPPPPKEVLTRPPHEIAFEHLEKLAAESYDTETYHARISYIIREYIAARYHIPALALTTTSLVQQMTHEQVNDSYVRHIQQFLANCDKVKFATYIAEKSEADAMMVGARWFVEETK